MAASAASPSEPLTRKCSVAPCGAFTRITFTGLFASVQGPSGASLEYTKTRETFGRPIAARQLVQQKLTTLATQHSLGLLMARRLGIYMGLDIARGPEETAIYIQAGSAWR